jgi:hypothetical protein
MTGREPVARTIDVVPCPLCRAQIGEPCVTAFGNERPRVHSSRAVDRLRLDAEARRHPPTASEATQ